MTLTLTFASSFIFACVMVIAYIVMAKVTQILYYLASDEEIF